MYIGLSINRDRSAVRRPRRAALAKLPYSTLSASSAKLIRSISEISSCFFGPRPWHIEIRHRVKQISTINLFGFETLKLKIRRLKLWKPTVATKNGLRLFF